MIFSQSNKALSAYWRGYCGRVGHVMLERIVDIEADCCHDGHLCRLRGGGKGARAERKRIKGAGMGKELKC